MPEATIGTICSNLNARSKANLALASEEARGSFAVDGILVPADFTFRICNQVDIGREPAFQGAPDNVNWFRFDNRHWLCAPPMLFGEMDSGDHLLIVLDYTTSEVCVIHVLKDNDIWRRFNGDYEEEDW